MAAGHSAVYEPQPHQNEAVDAIVSALGEGGRAQVTMACGSGKTLVGRWAAERIGAQTVVVLCPSLALVAQTVSAWRRAGGWHFEAILVCSDPTTAAGARERADGEPQGPWWASYGAKVTLLPEQVAATLQRARAGRPVVVFSTYHSAPVVSEAVAALASPVDLVIADEAHCLSGSPRQDFRHAVDGRLATKRSLFMTATRVVSRLPGALSMDDESIFGPVVHRLSFSEAIERSLLTDYRVVVYESSSGPSGQVDAISAMVHGASGDRAVRRVLSFHGRVKKGLAFAGQLDGYVLPDGRTVRGRSVSGQDSIAKRERALSVLDDVSDDEVALVASARCLSEGVDLPAVDAVVFADPRTSLVDITQAIGRVLRRSPGKTMGTILIPLVVPAGTDDDVGARNGAYRNVWTVLQALKEMDPSLGEELDAIERGPSRRGCSARRTPHVEFRVPMLSDLRVLLPRKADIRAVPWAERVAAVREFAEANGHTRLPKSTSLGLWCDMQRRRYRGGYLSASEAADLRAIPHWAWDVASDRWMRQLEQVLSCGVADPTSAGMDERLRVRSAGEPRTAGQWCAAQRSAQRQKLIDPERAELLGAVRGWAWKAVSDRDAEHVDLLREFVAWKQHANVPEDWSEDDLHLGAWLREVRRRRAIGTLDRALLHEIEFAVLSVADDAGRALRWYTPQVQWALGLEAMRQFVAREGHARVPYKHVEELRDTSVRLSEWCTRQRFSQRHGTLGPRAAAALQSIPGWQWEVQPAPRVLLDIGDSRHGTRTGYVKGCRCDDCTEANTLENQAREAAIARGEQYTRLVDAGRSRGHLRILLGRGASIKGMARALGMNPKSVTEIAEGVVQRVLPETETAVLALTLDGVEQASQGLQGVLVDAEPVWAMIEEMLELGWPKSWIARELGSGRSLQLRKERVSARSAQQVADLRKRVGQTRAPRRKSGKPTPSLDEVLAAA